MGMEPPMLGDQERTHVTAGPTLAASQALGTPPPHPRPRRGGPGGGTPPYPTPERRRQKRKVP